ncbi:MAG: TRAP transporter permease [Hydrogenophaga sp.]|jgi:TRAP transporter 4TM/12TM fusion protein|uniref:TRAP transporter permease n=2 Tax=Hydrogenophaga sp. TaxID=1904254 RepID=UPI002A361ED5|nr:TRAP transporter permease [Hydrogenophaga sp.]MDX9968094.1 TRAP transporter permease [Hydrogenophaga sp.]
MSDIEKASPDLQAFVAEVDTGGRNAKGVGGLVIALGALGWALFQLWYASPVPFALGFGIFNDTEARAIHLGMAMFLAFLAFPYGRHSPRQRIPVADWVLALVAGFAGAYLMLFYRELATRPGQPVMMDVVTACVGIVLLLETTRRAVGLPMTILGLVFLAYVFLGPYLPDVIAHKGASLHRMVSHMWLTTEGVYGVALGVSVAFIFIFVLFGALLDRAGGGNYMMQVSFALLGHMRGGPAKVAVVSSALNGLISGSSVSNVVTGGIFTIPLMKKAGYGGIKAGAIETASSINGQIMPPVMGAAAFLMVEYVGIPYVEIIKHALLPAVISYVALFYIVHLEALKLGIRPMAQAAVRTARERWIARALGVSGTFIVIGAVYWIAIGTRTLLGGAAPYVLMALLFGAYVWLVRVAARSPDLPQDIDINNPVLPPAWPTVRAGLFYLIPIGVLIWCLGVDELSPALSAFWATITMVALMLTQRPLLSFFRGHGMPGSAWAEGVSEVYKGFVDGSRNMIGIGIATATAGIVVGGITLTGLGFRMTDFVELVSQGNVILMLLFTAFVCLVLGLGVPTTANYVLMASLMAPVIVELGAQSGLVIPLIAVHLFVFYYGIMADITPPAGLATFAAAAISKEDPIKTGVQGSLYALRTVVLPFVFIFNPALLMIDVHGWWEVLLVAATATIASLTFAAATMAWFRTRCLWWEVLALLAVTFFLFRPDWAMDRIAPPYAPAPAADIYQVAESLGENDRLVLQIHGTNIEGDEVRKTVAVQLGAPGQGRERLQAAGVTIMALGDMVQIANVRFGSQARKSGFEPGWDIAAVMVPTDRPSAYWVYPPALLLLGVVWLVQGWRMRRPGASA